MLQQGTQLPLARQVNRFSLLLLLEEHEECRVELGTANKEPVVALHATAPEERDHKVSVRWGPACAPPRQVELSLKLVNDVLQGLCLPAGHLRGPLQPRVLLL